METLSFVPCLIGAVFIIITAMALIGGYILKQVKATTASLQEHMSRIEILIAITTMTRIEVMSGANTREVERYDFASDFAVLFDRAKLYGKDADAQRDVTQRLQGILTTRSLASVRAAVNGLLVADATGQEAMVLANFIKAHI